MQSNFSNTVHQRSEKRGTSFVLEPTFISMVYLTRARASGVNTVAVFQETAVNGGEGAGQLYLVSPLPQPLKTQ